MAHVGYVATRTDEGDDGPFCDGERWCIVLTPNETANVHGIALHQVGKVEDVSDKGLTTRPKDSPVWTVTLKRGYKSSITDKNWCLCVVSGYIQ